MKKFNLTIAIILIATAIVFGQQEHLEPVGGTFDVYDFQFKYYAKIRNILFKGLSDDPVIRFLVLPSFSQEHVLDIEGDREKGKYYVVYHEVDKRIWYNEKPDKIELKKFKKEINKESAELIRQLFLKALRQTRYPDNETHGHDGTNYYFSAWDSGLLSGTVWSPRDNSRLSRLVNIGNELCSLTQAPGQAIEITGKLKEDIKKLTAEFK